MNTAERARMRLQMRLRVAAHALSDILNQMAAPTQDVILRSRNRTARVGGAISPTARF